MQTFGRAGPSWKPSLMSENSPPPKLIPCPWLWCPVKNHFGMSVFRLSQFMACPSSSPTTLVGHSLTSRLIRLSASFYIAVARRHLEKKSYLWRCKGPAVKCAVCLLHLGSRLGFIVLICPVSFNIRTCDVLLSYIKDWSVYIPFRKL